jgi:hypothetical protein
MNIVDTKGFQFWTKIIDAEQQDILFTMGNAGKQAKAKNESKEHRS